MMRLKIIILFPLFFLLFNCGYKVANLQKNYNILEVETSGDNRINYKIRNKLLVTSKNANATTIKLSLNSKKKKNIKEKNINNQITKYEIVVTTIIKYESINSPYKGEFSIIKTGDYSVSEKYSDTLNSEKNLIKNLINDIVEEIQDNLSTNFNDT